MYIDDDDDGNDNDGDGDDDDDDNETEGSIWPLAMSRAQLWQIHWTTFTSGFNRRNKKLDGGDDDDYEDYGNDDDLDQGRGVMIVAMMIMHFTFVKDSYIIITAS